MSYWKRVHELVADHVVGVGERAAERQHDAPSARLGDAARAFAEGATDHVGLLEVARGRVEDQWLAAAQRVIEQLGQARVPALGHARRQRHAGFFLRVVVDVEVLGLQDLEVEGLVLHLVLAEVLRRCGRTRTAQHGRECPDEH
jgi:hypothetical protein